jgi:pimeloyl-ACP methyl ester carboxylesterase
VPEPTLHEPNAEPRDPLAADPARDECLYDGRRMRERWFDVEGDGGVRLRARRIADASKDAPAILLHHGLASSQRIWDLMLPGLARRFRVVTYDARGHGLSAKPSSGYGFDHITADALAVIRAARLRRPIVVGHSWGADVALALAADHRRAVSGAVLVDGGVLRLRSSFATWDEAKRQLAPPLLAGTPLDPFRAGLARWSPVPLTPEVEAILLSLVRVDGRGRVHPRLSRANHFRILRAIWDRDAPALHAGLTVPTLAILAHGSAEAAFDTAKREAVQGLKAAGSPATFLWVEGIHDLPIQQPDLLVRRITRFAGSAVR